VVPIQVKIPPYFLLPPVCGSEVTVETGFVAAGDVVVGAAVVVAAGLVVTGADGADVVAAAEVAACVVAAGVVVVPVPHPATMMTVTSRIANGTKSFFNLSSYTNFLSSELEGS